VKIKLDENIRRRVEQFTLVVAPTQVGAYRAAACQLDKWIPAFAGMTKWRIAAPPSF
jgi:hypothetical protein